MHPWWKGLGCILCAAFAAGTVLGCSPEGPARPSNQAAHAAEPLSATTIRVYGFESLGDWSPFGSSPTLSLSSTRVEGSFSLSVAGGGWSSIQSRLIAKEDPAPSVVGFDLRIPSPQPNPDWFGTVILFVSIPSQGVFEVPLGNHDLIAWTPGQWRRAEFTLPTSVRDALNANFANDLQWRIELNRPATATAGYLFDRFTYGPCVPQSDNNPCTADTCNAQGQQFHTPVPAGTSCADANLCNGAETCNATGTCVAGTPVTCTASDQCHNAGTCNPTTGCSNPAKANGTACNDSNACTRTDTCQSGTCTGGNPVVCTASDQCHNVGTCNTGTGVCSNPAKPNGTACTDNNACTAPDTCQSGACAAGAAVVCTPSDQCHNAGTCTPATGCSNPSKPNGSTCSDGNACTQMDRCQSGTCTAGPPLVCTASDQCHNAGTCDTGTGVCSNPAKPNNTACNDTTVCNGSETCQAGTCSPGTPLVVDDVNPCTADACDPVTGVSHTFVTAGTSCADSNPWNGTETCDGAGHCQPGTPVTCIATGTRDTAIGSREECDDGGGNEADLCSASCRVTDALAVRGPAGGQNRYLGESRHPVSAGRWGFGIAFVEPYAQPPIVGLSVFDTAGDPRARLSLNQGSTPVLFSDPAVAALDDGSYAVAWTDFGRDGDGLGIALRRVRPATASGDGPPISGADLGASLSLVQFANGTTAFSQSDADLLRVGSELIVAWTDASDAFTAPDLRYRVFDVGSSGSSSTFRALGGERLLAQTDDAEGNVALAPFGDRWAAAWRTSLANGEETIAVTLPETGVSWMLDPHSPGAPEDRPALAELDADHLAVLFSVGTDASATGAANVSRLRLAVLSIADPDSIEEFDFLPDDDAYADPAVPQSNPSLVRAGGVLYAAWRAGSLFGSAEGDNVFLRKLTWNGAVLAPDVEHRIPRTPAGSLREQRFPALAVGPRQLGSPRLPDPAPEGALVIAWDDYGREFGATVEGRPDVLVQHWPLPLTPFIDP